MLDARCRRVQGRGELAEQATCADVQAYRTACPDPGAARNRVPRPSAATWLSIAAAAIAALMVAAAGAAIPGPAASGDLDASAEIRVIESDLAEPFVVCTKSAQVTRCKELDLSTGRR